MLMEDADTTDLELGREFQIGMTSSEKSLDEHHDAVLTWTSVYI